VVVEQLLLVPMHQVVVELEVLEHQIQY
jgi:hypothetical protein